MKKSVTTLCMVWSAAGLAQQPENSVWFSMQLPVTIGRHWQWHNDAGYRTVGISATTYQYLYRTGLRYNLSKQRSVAAGTAYFFTRTDYQRANNEFGKEFRLWQEVHIENPIAKIFSVQNRFRIEQRWFNATSILSPYFSLRCRYGIAFTKKISHTWSIQLANEAMWQQANKEFDFNQNRLSGSFICKLKKYWSITAGYMWLKRPSVSQQIILTGFQRNIFIHGDDK